MDQKQLLEIIEFNSNLSESEMKKEALNAGINEAQFEKVYKKFQFRKSPFGLAFLFISIPLSLFVIFLKHEVFYLINPLAVFISFLATSKGNRFEVDSLKFAIFFFILNAITFFIIGSFIKYLINPNRLAYKILLGIFLVIAYLISLVLLFGLASLGLG